jgi:hypothetical protein
MRTKLLRLVLIMAGLSLPLLADAPASAPTPTPTPVPTMPPNIKLTNGAVLHNVSVVRWLRESVTLRHTGGADTIYYNYIAEPDRTTVLAVRDDAIKNGKADLSPKRASNLVKGTVSVSSDEGADIPLSGVTVYAVPIDALNMLSTNATRLRLPKPLATAVTGPEGQFSMTVPAGEDFFIFAKATKFVGQGWQHYEWRVPISQVADRQSLTLSGAGVVPLAEQKAVSFD